MKPLTIFVIIALILTSGLFTKLTSAIEEDSGAPSDPTKPELHVAIFTLDMDKMYDQLIKPFIDNFFSATKPSFDTIIPEPLPNLDWVKDCAIGAVVPVQPDMATLPIDKLKNLTWDDLGLTQEDIDNFDLFKPNEELFKKVADAFERIFKDSFKDVKLQYKFFFVSDPDHMDKEACDQSKVWGFFHKEETDGMNLAYYDKIDNAQFESCVETGADGADGAYRPVCGDPTKAQACAACSVSDARGVSSISALGAFFF